MFIIQILNNQIDCFKLDNLEQAKDLAKALKQGNPESKLYLFDSLEKFESALNKLFVNDNLSLIKY